MHGGRHTQMPVLPTCAGMHGTGTRAAAGRVPVFPPWLRPLGMRTQDRQQGAFTSDLPGVGDPQRTIDVPCPPPPRPYC